MKEWLRGLVVGLLTAEARLALRIHHPKIVAVTGNVGKTTTKDAIFAAIPATLKARKSQKSFNSDIGVPLAILAFDNPWSNPFKWAWTLIKGFVVALMPGYPQLLVLEVGADKPGDISSIAKWLKPDIAVFTGVPKLPVHVVYFPSRDALVSEKRALLEHIKLGGTAIVNGDFDVAEATQGIAAKVITYGTDPSCDVSASDVRVSVDTQGLPTGMSANVTFDGSHVPLQVTGALGRPVVTAALAALAVARALDVDAKIASHSLAKWQPTPGRMHILQGKNGSILIDDTYNASPVAMRSALETLAQLGAKRKIAVLGDMRELGDKSVEAHREIGTYVAAVADMLVTVGEESKVLAQAARDAGMAKEKIREYGYDTSQQVGEDLAKELRAGDVVLLKGSQNRIRLERCVYELLADPSQAQELLVRFDNTWRRKR